MVRRKRTKTSYGWMFSLCMILAAAAAFSTGAHESLSQVAVGAAADMQCTGNYDPTYQYPKINPKTKKQGLLGKPCQDTTNGHVTKGTCQAMGKCKGEETGGEKPQLPELPKPEPGQPGEQSCPPPTGSATTSTSSPSTLADPNCPQQPGTSGMVSPLSNMLLGGTSDASINADASAGAESNNSENGSGAGGGASAWTRLLVSLGIQTASTQSAAPSESSGASQQGVSFTGDAGQIAPSGAGANQGSTQVTQDLSFTARTSTFGEASGVPQATASLLSSLASTLSGMLATIRGWIQ